MSKPDYYKTLGIEKNSSESEIKKAYRKKAMKYHPDRNPDDKNSENKFKEAKEAYENAKATMVREHLGLPDPETEEE